MCVVRVRASPHPYDTSTYSPSAQRCFSARRTSAAAPKNQYRQSDLSAKARTKVGRRLSEATIQPSFACCRRASVPVALNRLLVRPLYFRSCQEEPWISLVYSVRFEVFPSSTCARGTGISRHLLFHDGEMASSNARMSARARARASSGCRAHVSRALRA